MKTTEGFNSGVSSLGLWSVLAALIGCTSLSGCASMNHQPQSPDEQLETSYSEPTEPTPVEPNTSETNDEVAQASAESSEPASSDDLQQALQVVIQDDALLNELKLGEPGRFPLKIAGNSVSSGLQLEAKTSAVEVISEPADTKTTAVLVFTDVDINAKQGTFKYRYDIEGVRGTSYVVKNKFGVWELKSSRVSGY